MTECLLQTACAAIYHADWRCLWRTLFSKDIRPNTMIVDAPYSEKTHSGHNNDSVSDLHRTIGYDHWTPYDVQEFVSHWRQLVSGWFVSITDDTLAPVWKHELEHAGLYTFAYLPYVAPGSRIRQMGDGPSSWTCWIVVARPRTKEFLSWGTLDGAYILPRGQGGAMPIVGGKPPWLMCRLVEDYSRPGDLIVDPCCGAGTTGIGALRTGRRCILGDKSREHAKIAVQWIKNPNRKAPYQEAQETPHRTLFG